MSNVVPLSTFPKAEVMAWLQALRSWEAANGIIGDLDDSSRVIAAPAISTPAPIAKSTPTRSDLTQSALMPSAPMQSALMRSAPIRLTPARPAPTSETQPASPPPQERGPTLDAMAGPRHRRGAGRILLAGTLAIAAIGLAVIGLTVNTQFAASFGQTAEAALLLAGLGLAIDVLAILLPSAAAELWRDRHCVAGCACWGIWLMALVMTLLAAMGFAATNIGDGVAGRSKVATEANGLAADIARLRGERAGIVESRSITTIEAEIQRAQPVATAVWRQTAGCSDVTLAASGAACAEILKLRQALGAAQRRGAIDAELRTAEARLAALPAITTSDPQAAMAADILSWASIGHVNLTPHDIHRLRITGLTIIPALSGIILMFAVTLLRVGVRA